MTNQQENIHVPSLRLDGRLAVVIGASQGIGRTLSIALAMAGAEVVLGSRRLEALSSIKTEIEKIGGNSLVLPLDVRQLPQISQFASRIKEKTEKDDPPIVLVNSAGVDLTKPAVEVTETEWDAVLETHLKGLFFTCQAIGRLMIRQGYGKIINLSSTWSSSTDPGKSVYCAAKAAVSHLTSALATEWAPYGVRVNALAPTATLTPPTLKGMENKERANRLLRHIPMGQFAYPEDLVGAALFLASEASDFVTGHTLFVDGGWRAKS